MATTYSIRLEEAEAAEFDAFCAEHHRHKSDALREFVKAGLKAAKDPGPAPAPTPQPAPQPAPKPTPAPPVPWPGPGPRPLDPAIAARQPQLDAIDRGLASRLFGAGIGRSWLKLAVLGGAAMVVIGGWAPPLNLALMAWGVFVVALATLIDLLRSGSDYRSVILGRGRTDVRQLIALIPIEYEQACKTMAPGAAAAHVLAMIDERLARLGQTSVKDL